MVDEDNERTEDLAFRERLGLLVKEHQLRGLARRLDIKHQKIIRYMKGAQPSAAFCRRLVQKVGVNPTWLLTGEGSPKLSDVPDKVASTASDLLELVQAMTAVSKMRLGALAGKQHLKVMRELNDAMVSYEQLRKRINAQSRESFRQIIDMLHTSVDGSPDLGKASHLVKAGEQVLQLCDDPVMRRAFLREVAMYELFSGNPGATEHNLREVVLAGFLTCKEGLDEQSCIDAHNLIGGLRQQLRLAEASRIAEATIALTTRTLRKTPRFNFLLEVAGANDIDNGKLKRGLARIVRAMPHLTRDKQQNSTIPRLAGAHFFAGTMNFREAKAYCGKWGPLWINSMALWSEDPKELRDAYSIAENWGGSPKYFLLLLGKYAEYIALALHSGTSKTLASFDAAVAHLTIPVGHAEANRCLTPIIRTRIAQHSGDMKNAIRLFQQTDRYLLSVAPAIALPLHFAAMHHRNALALTGISDALDTARARALKFFRKHVAGGYMIFKPLLTSAGVAASSR